MSRCFLGIDVGTTAMKVLAAEYPGCPVAATYQEYPLAHPTPQSAEQDMELVWNALLEGVDQAAAAMTPEQRRNVKALSLSTQRSTMVPVGADGTPLRHAITWMDGRSGKECDALSCAVGKSRVYELTGNPVSTIWTLSYLLWLRAHEPELWEETACFANVHAFLMKRLGCEGFYLDYSNAGETMMFDPQGKCWSEELLRYAGLSVDRLPVLVESGSRIGTLCSDLAERFGFGHDVALIAGGGDQQCAALGCSAAQDGDVSIGMGTAANILALSGECRRDSGEVLIATPSVLPGKWFLEGSLIACGPILNWVRDLAYAQEPPETVYRTMDDEAEKLSAPGANGVLLLPHFQGAGCPYWDEAASGVFFGLTLSSTRADLARAVMEGLAFDVGKSLRMIVENGITPRRIFLTGGAAKSDIWCQIQADVYGLPLFVPQTPNVAAVGALILAACGSGELESVEEGMKAFTQIRGEYRPDPERHRLYQELLEQSDQLFHAVSGRRP